MKWDLNAVKDALLVVTFDGFFDLGCFCRFVAAKEQHHRNVDLGDSFSNTI